QRAGIGHGTAAVVRTSIRESPGTGGRSPPAGSPPPSLPLLVAAQ
uniref:Uncharacterized protein n=1 Tax=Plectus sambesii TaxID=2011161 RepID=A0A914VEX8_9BILA